MPFTKAWLPLSLRTVSLLDILINDHLFIMNFDGEECELVSSWVNHSLIIILTDRKKAVLFIVNIGRDQKELTYFCFIWI